MPVARETIIAALHDLLKLEEFSIENLADVERYDFGLFDPEEKRKMKILLSKLKEDTVLHQKKVSELIDRLKTE
ncbi:MAG: hypothetical protein U1F57_09290 [bacterium]